MSDYKLYFFPSHTMRLSLHTNIHPARAEPGFYITWSDSEYYYSLPSWGASPSQGYPPTFYQASLTLCLYPFILLSGERHCESMVSCPRTQHMDWPGLEPRPLDPESSTLTIRPPHLWVIQWVGDGFLSNYCTPVNWAGPFSEISQGSWEEALHFPASHPITMTVIQNFNENSPWTFQKF